MEYLLVTGLLLVLSVYMSMDLSWNNVLASVRNQVVFEGRNKLYGAFVLRRDYVKRLMMAVGGSLIIVGLAISTPMIAAAFAKDDAELFADELEFIHQDGEGELLGFRLGGRGVARVLRVDGVEEDALVLVGGLQLGELGSGFTRNLAAIDLAHQDDGRGALEVVEFVSETVRVRQLEVGGAFRHGRDRRGRGRSRNG